jgi:hypothetical protein
VTPHGKTGRMSQVVNTSCLFLQLLLLWFATLLTRKLVHFNYCVVTPMTLSSFATCDWFYHVGSHIRWYDRWRAFCLKLKMVQFLHAKVIRCFVYLLCSRCISQPCEYVVIGQNTPAPLGRSTITTVNQKYPSGRNQRTGMTRKLEIFHKCVLTGVPHLDMGVL